jgi:hypothetical protein
MYNKSIRGYFNPPHVPSGKNQVNVICSTGHRMTGQTHILKNAETSVNVNNFITSTEKPLNNVDDI